MADWLPYERGAIVSDTRDDHAKLREAWRVVRARRDAGLPVVNLTGLERALDPADVEPGLLDDELAPALLGERFRELALEHLGGDPLEDEAFLANRTTAGLVATMQTLVPDGGVVVGVSAGYTHPAVVRSVLLARGRLVDSVGADGFAAALATEPRADVVVVTRLAVTYEALATDELSAIVAAARDREVVIVADDAGGARVGPACLGQPRTLELGVDVGVTGLDKYGVTGPRLGLVAGRAELVHAIRARATELGLEARPMLLPAALGSLERYLPERVRELVRTTQELGDALELELGSVVTRTPFALKLRGESIRAAAGAEGIAPVEATAAVAMQLLRDHGLLTVHFAAVPPGTPDLLLKFVPPETLAELGGAEALVTAIASSFERAVETLRSADSVHTLLYGSAVDNEYRPAESGSPRTSTIG
jgi:L-seryl-tRNA(Ser) seleniumtransferase